MPFLFLCLSFLSGLFGLSYEVIYQRILLSVIGDLFGIYVIVVTTFILGMALGNLAGFHLRRFLPWVEASCGLFALGTGFFLRHGGYMVAWPYPALVGLMLLPAFAIGAAIPLYAYYYRQVKFRWLYSLYHLGAVAAILFIELYLFPRVAQSTLLLALGSFHVLLGCFLLGLYRTGVFIVEPPRFLSLRVFGLTQKKLCAGVFLFSLASTFYQFWALKAVFLTLYPLRMLSSFAIAASLFWIFIGSLLPPLGKGRQGFWRYSFFFLLHTGLMLASIPLWKVYIGRTLLFGIAPGYALFTFFAFSPCLWATSYLIAAIAEANDNRADRIDFASGALLFVSSIANCVGFFLAISFGNHIDSSFYFLPFALFFVLPFAALGFADFSRYQPRRLIVACIGFVFLVGAGHFCLQPRGLYRDMLIANKQQFNAFGIVKSKFATFLSVEDNLRVRLEALVPTRYDTMNMVFDKARFYPSAQATIVLLPFYKSPLFVDGSGRISRENMDTDIFYGIDGYTSHPLHSSAQLAAGFIARMYFNEPIPSSFVAGLGSGQTALAVTMTSKQADLVEISSQVLRVLEDLSYVNDDIIHHDKATLIHDDAMRYLKRTDKKYDALINTSSGQQTIWSAKLYSTEFLDLVKAHMSPGGLYETWVNSTTFEKTETFLSYIALLKKYFAFVDVHYLGQSYVVFVCYDKPREHVFFDPAYLDAKAVSFFAKEPVLLPHFDEMNAAILRNVSVDPAIPVLETSLDFPGIEIEAVDTLLHKPEAFLPSFPLFPPPTPAVTNIGIYAPMPPDSIENSDLVRMRLLRALKKQNPIQPASETVL